MSDVYGYGGFSPQNSDIRSERSSSHRYRSALTSSPHTNQRYRPKMSSALNRKWVHRSHGDLSDDNELHLATGHDLQLPHPRLQADFYQDLYQKYPGAFQRRRKTHEISRGLFNAKPRVRFEDEMEFSDDRSEVSLRSTRSERPLTNWDKEVGHYKKNGSRSRECLTSAEPSESGGSVLSVKQRLHQNSQTLRTLLNEKSPLRRRFATDHEGVINGANNGGDVPHANYNNTGKENGHYSPRHKVFQRPVTRKHQTANRVRSQSELGFRSVRNGSSHIDQTTTVGQSRDISLHPNMRTLNKSVESIMAETDLKIDTLIEQLSMKMSSPESPPDSAIDMDTPSVLSIMSTERGGYSDRSTSAPYNSSLVIELYEDGHSGLSNNSRVDFEYSRPMSARGHNSEGKVSMRVTTGQSAPDSSQSTSSHQNSVYLGEYAFSEDGAAPMTREETRSSQPVLSSSDKSESGHCSLTSQSDEVSEMDKIVQNFVHNDKEAEVMTGPGEGLLQFYMDVSQEPVDVVSPRATVAMETHTLKHPKPANETNNSDPGVHPEPQSIVEGEVKVDNEMENNCETADVKEDVEMLAEQENLIPLESVHKLPDTDTLPADEISVVAGTKPELVNVVTGNQQKSSYNKDLDVDSWVQTNRMNSNLAIENRGRPRERGTTPMANPVKGNHSILPSRDDVDSSILDEINLSQLSHGLSRDLYGRGGNSRLEEEKDDTDPQHSGVAEVSAEERKLADRYHRRRSPSPYILRPRKPTAGVSRPSSVSSAISTDIEVRVVDICLSDETSDNMETAGMAQNQNITSRGRGDQVSESKPVNNKKFSMTSVVNSDQCDIKGNGKKQCIDLPESNTQPSIKHFLVCTEDKDEDASSESSCHREQGSRRKVVENYSKSCQRHQDDKSGLIENTKLATKSGQRIQTVNPDQGMSSTPVQHRKHSLSSCSYSVSSAVSSVSSGSAPNAKDHYSNTKYRESKSRLSNETENNKPSTSLKIQQKTSAGDTSCGSSSHSTTEHQAEFETDSSVSSIGRTHGKFKPSTTSPRVKEGKKKLRNIFKNKKGSYNPASEAVTQETGAYMSHHVTFGDPVSEIAHDQEKNLIGHSNTHTSEQEELSLAEDLCDGYATVGSVRNVCRSPASLSSSETGSREVTHVRPGQISGEVTVHNTGQYFPDQTDENEGMMSVEGDNNLPDVVSAKPVYIIPTPAPRTKHELNKTGTPKITSANHQPVQSSSAANKLENKYSTADVSSQSSRTNSQTDSHTDKNPPETSAVRTDQYSSNEELPTSPADGADGLYAKINPALKQKTLTSAQVERETIETGPPLPDRRYDSNLEKMKGVSASRSSIMGGIKSATKGKFKALRKAMSLEKGLDQVGTGGHKQRSQPGGTLTRDGNSEGIKKAPSLKSLTSLFSRKKKKSRKFAAVESEATSDLPSTSSSTSGPLKASKKQQWSSCHTLPEMESAIGTQPRGKLLHMNSDGTQTIELTKPSEGPIGFFIAQGNAQYNNGIFVSRFRDDLTENQFADLLCIGDEILEINGHLVRDLSLDGVYSVMGSSPNVVMTILPLIIRRDV